MYTQNLQPLSKDNCLHFLVVIDLIFLSSWANIFFPFRQNTFLSYSETRAPVSMGAVGASAPMVFKVVGASTHTFLAIFSPIHLKKDKTKVNNSSFVQKMNLSTHALKFLAGTMNMAIFNKNSVSSSILSNNSKHLKPTNGCLETYV